MSVGTNGDFSLGFAGWFVDGDAVVSGPFSSAILGEGSPSPGPAPGLLSQAFLLPASPVSLTFEFSFDVGADVSGGGLFDDFFQVELLATGQSELFTDSFGFPSDAILAVDRFGVFENQGTIGAGTNLSSQFTLSLTGLGLSAGDELTITALTFGDADGFSSVGVLDNVSATVIPVPGAALLALVGLAHAASFRRWRRDA